MHSIKYYLPSVVILSAIVVVFFLRLFLDQPLFFSLAVIFVACFSIPGYIFALVQIDRLGELRSLLGKAFSFLGFSFLFQFVGFCLNFFIYHYQMPYPAVLAFIYALMYLSWALSVYFFLISAGIPQKLHILWKIIIIATLILGLSMLVYGIFFTNLPYSSNLYDFAIIGSNAVMIIETIFLCVYAKNFKGSPLFSTALFVCLGITFQLLADLVVLGMLPIKDTRSIYNNVLYGASWFFLSIVPVPFFTADKNTSSKKVEKRKP